MTFLKRTSIQYLDLGLTQLAHFGTDWALASAKKIASDKAFEEIPLSESENYTLDHLTI